MLLKEGGTNEMLGRGNRVTGSILVLGITVGTCAWVARAPASTLHALLNVSEQWYLCPSVRHTYPPIISARSVAIQASTGDFACQTGVDTDGSTANGDCGEGSGQNLLHKVEIGHYYPYTKEVESAFSPTGAYSRVSWGPVKAAPLSSVKVAADECTAGDPQAPTATFTGTSWITDP
jgi:hypothetical protein